MEQILSDLTIFFKPEDVVELRALGKNKSVIQSGYYRDHEKLIDTISVLDKIGEHKGIYFVLNQIDPALYARRPDVLASPRDTIETTSDREIVRRRWLPVDLDPVRPAGISSTEEEHNLAIQKAKEIRDSLGSLGWPEPVLADSGNGAHLLYSIDLPNTSSTTELVKQVLRALDALFSDDKVKVDIQNFNAARIWKAYGTMARKGANVSDRPWRRSRIIEMPTQITTAPEKLLTGLMWGLKQKEEADRRGNRDFTRNNVPGKSLDLEKWLSFHNLDVAKSKSTHSGGQLYVLNQCPWDSSHNDRSAWAMQFPSGAIAAGCHHNSCAGKSWSDLRRLYEPDIQKSLRKTPGDISKVAEDILDVPHIPFVEGKIASIDMLRPAIKAIENLKIEDVADIKIYANGETSVTFNASKAVDAVSQYVNVLATPDKTIWVYDSGYYRPDGDLVIDQILDRVAGNVYSIHDSKEVMHKVYLRSVVGFEEIDKNPYFLCVENGVVDLQTGAFLEHSPEYRITMPCPIKYDPVARADCFLEFLSGSCSNDQDRQILIDWLVACACLVEFEYLLFLTGHGSNGKHVYEALLQAMFGSEATEAISLEELLNSRFALGSLRRARVCISSETNPDKTKTELIKKISGNDWLSCDVKNKGRVKFRAFTQMIFDSNSMPAFEDTSYGFTRRFTRVNMPFEFKDNPDQNDPLEKKADRYLLSKLTSPEELSGILNLIINRAKDIASDRKIFHRDADFEEYEKQSYSVTDFLQRFIEFSPEKKFDPDYREGADFLYARFNEYAKYSIGAKVSKNRLSKLIGKENREPSISIWKEGVTIRGFRGLRFDEIEFSEFIEDAKKSYSVSTDHNDQIVRKKNSVRDQTNISECIPNDLTNLTAFSNITYNLRESTDKEKEIGKGSMELKEKELDRSLVNSLGFVSNQHQGTSYSVKNTRDDSSDSLGFDTKPTSPGLVGSNIGLTPLFSDSLVPEVGYISAGLEVKQSETVPIAEELLLAKNRLQEKEAKYSTPSGMKSQYAAGLSHGLSGVPAPGQNVPLDDNPITSLDPATKRHIWAAVGNILRKAPRKDGRKLGLTLGELVQDVKLPSNQIGAYLAVNGWTSSQVDPGGFVIWWAPENVLKAYGLGV